eukprot:4733988-Pyramimonas_sp.AAC.1
MEDCINYLGATSVYCKKYSLYLSSLRSKTNTRWEDGASKIRRRRGLNTNGVAVICLVYLVYLVVLLLSPAGIGGCRDLRRRGPPAGIGCRDIRRLCAGLRLAIHRTGPVRIIRIHLLHKLGQPVGHNVHRRGVGVLRWRVVSGRVVGGQRAEAFRVVDDVVVARGVFPVPVKQR